MTRNTYAIKVDQYVNDRLDTYIWRYRAGDEWRVVAVLLRQWTIDGSITRSTFRGAIGLLGIAEEEVSQRLSAGLDNLYGLEHKKTGRGGITRGNTAT